MTRTTLLFVLFLTLARATAVSVTLNWMEPSACGTATGMIDIQVIGGTAPYTFQWNNGATTEDLTGLLPGWYDVTVTDANSAQATGSWNVENTGLYAPQSAQD